MKWHTKKLGTVLGMMGALLSWGASSHGQTFDTPVSDFVLEPASSNDSFLPNIPVTLNVGNFDPSIVAAGGRTLNEVAVAGVSQLSDEEEALIHRYWTIVHDSATDTRSLVQTAPSDILVTSEFEPFYFIPDSLQLADLNGNGVDDIALLGVVPQFNGVPVEVANLKLAKSGSGGPVGVFGVPSQQGPEFFATSINLLGQQTDSSIPNLFSNTGTQPSLAVADFDGDGNLDLAFYDFVFDEEGSQQLAVTLRNNGGFGTLPRTETVLNLPADLQGSDYAYNLVAADIDGDGVPDLAITFDADESDSLPDMLLVFKGNGDGSFVPDPIVSVTIGTDTALLSLTVGDFDGNEFLDFAVGSAVTEEDFGSASLNIILCNPGTPASCSVEVVALPGFIVPFSLTSADFDGDGLDDLAFSYIACSDEEGECNTQDIESGVSVHLNQGGAFNPAPDQTLLMGGATTGRIVLQVVAKDIDACGGPDLAYTGFELGEEPEPVELVSQFKAMVQKQGVFSEVVNYASVAFNHNEDPVADAGAPVPTDGGIRVGGDPTCTGEPGEELLIQWEVLSGDAEISDPTAANPLVSASGDVVLQVTCTDLCGAASSSTVTVQGGAFLLNGSGCSLGGSAASGAGWLLGLAGLLPLAIRRFRA